MKERCLQVLTVKICNHRAVDIALIFAEPSTKDLEGLIREESLVQVIHSLLWADEFKERENVLKVEAAAAAAAHTPGDSLEVKLETGQNLSASLSSPLNQSGETLEEDEDKHENHYDEGAFLDDDDEGTKIDDRSEEDEFRELDQQEGRKRGGKSKRKRRSRPIPGYGSNESIDLLTQGDYMCPGETRTTKDLLLQSGDLEPEHRRTCPHCLRVFSTKTLLRTHLRQICREMKDVSCDACQAKFDTGEQLEDHVKSDHGKGFKCDYCSYVAGIYRYKILHEKRLHLNMDCSVCSKLFESVEERDGHHCVKPDRFQCNQCEKNYKVKGELKKHIDTIHKGIKYPCPQCPDILSSTQSLKRHIRTVHETLVKNFRCDICSKAFKDGDYLQRHMRIHEDSSKSFVCQECGKFFKYKVTLKSHIRTMHEKILKQTCEECGKSFPDMHKLKVHSEMVHMKGELFMCQVCGKEMIGKNRLRNHMMTHPKGQKFVACEQCGKEVAETQLRSHIVQAHKMHTYKYPCQYCPKRLDTKAHIRAHIRKHTGARPYLCRGCGKYYPLLETAQKHTRIFHSGDYSLVLYDISKDIDNPYVNGT